MVENITVKRNTKDILADSFKRMLKKMPIEKITIKEITDMSGVIRPTFYNHFSDKYELLEYIIRNDLLLPAKPLFVNSLMTEGCALIFSNIKNEREFYENAIKIEGQNSFESVVRHEVANFLLEVIREKNGGYHSKYAWLSKQTIAEYYAQSLCYVAITWIKQDLKITPKELAEVYEYLARSNMMDVLNELV